jgi:hypothetical protein
VCAGTPVHGERPSHGITPCLQLRHGVLKITRAREAAGATTSQPDGASVITRLCTQQRKAGVGLRPASGFGLDIASDSARAVPGIRKC